MWFSVYGCPLWTKLEKEHLPVQHLSANTSWTFQEIVAAHLRERTEAMVLSYHCFFWKKCIFQGALNEWYLCFTEGQTVSSPCNSERIGLTLAVWQEKLLHSPLSWCMNKYGSQQKKQTNPKTWSFKFVTKVYSFVTVCWTAHWSRHLNIQIFESRFFLH